MSAFKFVQGGGGQARRSSGNPVARFFVFAAAVWFGVCLIAAVPFMLDGWPASFTPIYALSLLAFLLEIILVALALVFSIIGSRSSSVRYERNSNYDLRNLY